MRILSADLGLKIIPELGLHMLEGVHADVRDLALSDPTFDVVDEVIYHIRVTVIEVRKAVQLSLDAVSPTDIETGGFKIFLRSVPRMIYNHASTTFMPLASHKPTKFPNVLISTDLDPLEVKRPIVVIGSELSWLLTFS